jgi:hypothetical protein
MRGGMVLAECRHGMYLLMLMVASGCGDRFGNDALLKVRKGMTKDEVDRVMRPYYVARVSTQMLIGASSSAEASTSTTTLRLRVSYCPRSPIYQFITHDGEGCLVIFDASNRVVERYYSPDDD